MDLEVLEDGDFLKILFKDAPKDVAIETTVESDADKTVKLAVSKDGQVTLKEIVFSRDIYSLSDVTDTKNRIQTRFAQEGCKPCIALSEANQTDKTFVLPFLTVLKDLFNA